ncbi:YcaO-like family protein [Tropicimonas sp. TH_r6]|uniref:YcaO-like family protein n=1 Tax=Tropicimonas sp. TH_r6 TaxID=3082085 RepID=UPI002954C6C8|nr:YcaO-like family protein [Tropicimonas sp. TH_r6]MDV7142560.1 YcaO-like family protein [Tropicimonas sp. TH_r6]
MRWSAEPPPAEFLSAAIDAAPERSLDAGAFWQRLRPRLRDFGISRVADITGLDHVGFPVAQAVRPEARSNAVTQGKASSLEGAAVGAVLECLEMAAGEDVARLPVAGPCDRIDWSVLAPTGYWPDAGSAFVAAWDIGRDAPGAVPQDLLSTDFSRGAEAEAAPILRQSIGLGAGTNFAAAMMHGLLECIEADARVRAEAGGRWRRVAPDRGDARFGALLTRLEERGMRVLFHDMSRRDDVVSVAASVMEPPGASALPLPAAGYGCRPSVSAAMDAALSEAVQARLAVISGAREDITQRAYRHNVPAELLDAEWARHAPGPALAAASPKAPNPTLRSLAAGRGPVLAVPLRWDAGIPLAIVRVIAPDLLADPLRGAVA